MTLHLGLAVFIMEYGNQEEGLSKEEGSGEFWANHTPEAVSESPISRKECEGTQSGGKEGFWLLSSPSAALECVISIGLALRREQRTLMKCTRSKGRRERGREERSRIRNINREEEGNGVSRNYFCKKDSK